MTTIIAIGIDIGPHPGLVRLVYSEQALVKVSVAQVSADLLGATLVSLFQVPGGAPYSEFAEVYVGLEAFVHSSKGGGAAGKQTRDQVGSVFEICTQARVHCTQRPAVRVKAWATTERLEKAKLLSATKGMTHARDGARHALFTAVEDGNIPDPLSRRAR